MKIGFIGHRIVFYNLRDILTKTIEEHIMKGYLSYIVGTHGQFDELVLDVLRNLRTKYNEIKIEVVITSFNQIKKEFLYVPYSDVDTIMYDIEDVYFKRKITYSNQRMVDECEILICFVNEEKYYSGAKSTMRYAQKKGVKVINLYPKMKEIFK